MRIFKEKQEILEVWLAASPHAPIFETTYGSVRIGNYNHTYEHYFATKDMCEHIMIMERNNIKATWTGDYLVVDSKSQ